jgi:hypothetical protein
VTTIEVSSSTLTSSIVMRRKSGFYSMGCRIVIVLMMLKASHLFSSVERKTRIKNKRIIAASSFDLPTSEL